MKEFENVIGYESIKQELYRLCDIIKNTEKYKKLGIHIPRGLLLYGVPGMGKTTMIKSFIEATGYKNIYTIRKNKPNSDFTNFINDTFKLANQNKPAIVFLDDMDKFSNEDSNYCDTEEFVTIQSCIDECSENVFVVATANDIDDLPESLLRAGRFDNKFELKKPSLEDSEKIVKHYLKNKMVDDNIDTLEIARILNTGSCAELEAVINLAGIYAGSQNKEKISKNDIIKASLRLIYETPLCLKINSKEVLEKIAVHEAGHTVMMELLSPNNFTVASLLQYESKNGGMTNSLKDDDYFFSKTKQENQIRILFGGKAATEIVYGILDIGASSDLERAERIFNRHLEKDREYEFSSEIKNNPNGQEIRNQLILQAELKRLYNTTKKILIKNKEFLIAVKNELLKKEFVTKSDIYKIKERVKIIPISQICIID